MSDDTVRAQRSPASPAHDDRIEAALAALSLEEKVRLLTGQTTWRTYALPGIGLRAMVTSDGPVGVRGQRWDEREPAANVPSPTALAATWDEPMVGEVGRLLAGEARRKGVDVLLAPTVNLHRSPLGGRHFECFSEDPLLTGRIGAAYVNGLQSGGVAATVKHYVANDSETDRMTVDVHADARTLRELYLAPFEHIVTHAHPWAIMAAYNRVDGVTMTESPLLADPLRPWGFDGVMMSDWTATRSTEAAARAELDLAMPGPRGPWGQALVDAVRAGRVPRSAIDAKVRNLLRLAARVGALGDVPPAVPAPDLTELAAPDSAGTRSLLRRVACAAMVLVRNAPPGNAVEGLVDAAPLLPLEAAALRRVAVLGPNAAAGRGQGGGSATVFPTHVVSPLDGLRAALASHGVEVTHAEGARTRDSLVPVGLPLLRHPETGRPGTRVRYLDATGQVVKEEHRLSGRVLWQDVARDFGATAVEVDTVLQSPAAGRWRLGLAGVGRLIMDVDGATVLDVTIAITPEQEDFATLVTPPQREVLVDLPTAAVAVHVRYEPEPVIDMIALELLAEAPRLGDADELDRAAALAADADVAIVVVGTTDLVESEGFDRTSLALPGNQDELVRRAAAANPRTVVVVNAGSPVLMPWREQVAAVLLAWFPGQEFGDALADVLLGMVEPGGRLPTTWPAEEQDAPVLSTQPVEGVLEYSEGLHIGYRAWARAAVDGGPKPAYWFGFGLGYTTWELASSTVVETGSEGVQLRVAVRNSGARQGRAVVQAYVSRPGSTLERPAFWLGGFAAAEAEPGAVVQVPITLGRRAFEHWDAAAQAWALEPGSFVVEIGLDAGERPVRADIALG